MAEVSPFDVVKGILNKTRLPDEDINNFSQWMVNKIFSCDRGTSLIANELNNQFVSNKMLYDCYYYGTPKCPNKYIPYNAKKAAADKELRYIMNYFNVNQNVAKQYQKLIGDDEKAFIVDYYEKRGVKK